MRLPGALILGAAIAAAASGCGAARPSSPARDRPRPPLATVSAIVPIPTVPSVARRATRVRLTNAARDPKRTLRRTRATLAGKVVGIDPGHNGSNYTDPTFLNRLIWNGRAQETCDTTGTETDAGYTEARFNFDLATYLTADLRAEGAKVVLTRNTNTGVGPCVTTRAQIINRAHANVAIDIHADGGPAGGRGFTVLEPIADGPNDRVLGASKAFGRDLLRSYRALTGMPVSTYDGVGGVALRSDLAGLNLTTVPKVLIECGNMRNATDAGLLVSPSFQKLAAKAFAEAITQYLRAGA